ncbi:MAG TPA: NAD(P)-dependent oxidoreductase [Candidatus Methanomethylicus sp.]|nr:NAD(P)-dependent oxidoreductase [Candidatus Methanomethylicus sp.]
MRVALTGASGFLGGYLAEALVRNGHIVIGLVRDPDTQPALLSLGAELRRIDLTDKSTLAGAVEGSDVIVHLAAYYTFHGRKEQYRRVNVEGTLSLIEAAAASGVRRFIYCSSTEAMGPVESPPADESAPLNPAYEYGRSKAEAEALVRSCPAMGIDYTIIRPSGIYGPRNVDDVAYWTITSFAKNSIATRFIVGDGQRLVQFTHVSDVVSGFMLAIEKPDASRNKTFIIAAESAHAYAEVYSILAEICGRSPPRHHLHPLLAKAMIAPVEALNRLAGRENFLWHTSTVSSVTSDRSYSIGKAKKELGFTPKYDLKTGLAETVEWYRAKGYL